MNKLFQRILPFFIFGLMLVVLIAGFILFSYLLILGGIVGLVLFIIAGVREKLFHTRDVTLHKRQSQQGRTFDHDDRSH